VALSQQFSQTTGIQISDVPVPEGTRDDIDVPGTVYDLDFMVKDARRFADSGGWGYAVFKHDAASGAYTPADRTHKPPQGNDAKCGSACHTIAKAKDYVFTEYAKR
jgi:Cytochrome P460